MTKPAMPLAIEQLAPGSLAVDPSNPRTHKPAQVDAIARSIRTFGFNVPVLASSDNIIIAGHGRLAAALKLGLTQIPVRIDHLSDHQRRAYMIADNRLGDSSKWSDQLLAEVLRDLSVADLDFELDAIGFSIGEIDLRIDAIELGAPEKDDVLPPAGPTISEVGDVWLLGRHRLVCGNSLIDDNWKLLMAGATANMAFTDPPYNVAVNGHVSGLGKHRHREFAMASGEMDRDDFAEFLSNIFDRMVSHSASGSMHYVCMDWRRLCQTKCTERNFGRINRLFSGCP